MYIPIMLIIYLITKIIKTTTCIIVLLYVKIIDFVFGSSECYHIFLIQYMSSSLVPITPSGVKGLNKSSPVLSLCCHGLNFVPRFPAHSLRQNDLLQVFCFCGSYPASTSFSMALAESMAKPFTFMLFYFYF